ARCGPDGVQPDGRTGRKRARSGVPAGDVLPRSGLQRTDFPLGPWRGSVFGFDVRRRVNPNAANDQCGECGGCAEYTYVGRLRFPNLGPPPAGSMFYSVLDGVCRSLCTPSRDNNGGCRPGYTCDIDTGLCLDAQCRSDAQCKLDVSEDGTDVVMNP